MRRPDLNDCVGYTFCMIWNRDKLVKIGTAICSMDDEFVESKGEKRALERTVSEFRKPLRKEFWETYLLKNKE